MQQRLQQQITSLTHSRFTQLALNTKGELKSTDVTGDSHALLASAHLCLVCDGHFFSENTDLTSECLGINSVWEEIPCGLLQSCLTLLKRE